MRTDWRPPSRLSPRRHLNVSQRAMIAAELADFDHGGDRSKSSNGGLKISEAAQALNVGERTVDRAKQVKDKAAVGGERWQIITAA